LMVGLGVDMATDVSVAVVTFRAMVAGVKLPNFAVIVTEPGDSPFTMPLALPTVAIAGADEDHTAFCVRSCVVPSANVPITDNWTEVSSANLEPGFGD